MCGAGMAMLDARLSIEGKGNSRHKGTGEGSASTKHGKNKTSVIFASGPKQALHLLGLPEELVSASCRRQKGKK